jgi:mannose-6-phosphate isomerase-like protein (cupin superfamily)
MISVTRDREETMAGAAARLEKPTAPAEPKAAAPKMRAAVTSAKTPDYVEGRRSFFKYRDLGVGAASQGWMRAQVMQAVTGMTQPTGWHYHVCEGQFVYALKGFVQLEFEVGAKCRLEAGDSCFIPGGMKHNEIRTSDDVEILEVCLPANMGTVPCEAPIKTG